MSVADLIAQSLPVSRSDAIIAADRDGVICFWNPGADRIFGYMRGEAIGRSLDFPTGCDSVIGMDIARRSRLEEALTVRAMCCLFQPFTKMEPLSRSNLPLCR